MSFRRAARLGRFRQSGRLRPADRASTVGHCTPLASWETLAWPPSEKDARGHTVRRRGCGDRRREVSRAAVFAWLSLRCLPMRPTPKGGTCWRRCSVLEPRCMSPPFFCDCGVDIELGRNVYFGSNCTIPDEARVSIGDTVLYGPSVFAAGNISRRVSRADPPCVPAMPELRARRSDVASISGSAIRRDRLRAPACVRSRRKSCGGARG